MTEQDEAADMPKDFGIKYVFWIICRWLYLNPLTLLFVAQEELAQLEISHPTVKWLAQAAGALGIIIAQTRNRKTDYTVPVAQNRIAQATAVLAQNPAMTPAQEKSK